MQEVILIYYTYIQLSVLMYHHYRVENPITQPLAHCTEKSRLVAKPCHEGSHSVALHIHPIQCLNVFGLWNPITQPLAHKEIVANPCHGGSYSVRLNIHPIQCLNVSPLQGC
jgi:hypothetical protein